MKELKCFKLLKFYSETCGPCKLMTKRLDEANLNIDIEPIIAEERQELCTKYNVRNIPTCILVNKEGEEIRRWNGIFDINELKEAIK